MLISVLYLLKAISIKYLLIQAYSGTKINRFWKINASSCNFNHLASALVTKYTENYMLKKKNSAELLNYFSVLAILRTKLNTDYDIFSKIFKFRAKLPLDFAKISLVKNKLNAQNLSKWPRRFGHILRLRKLFSQFLFSKKRPAKHFTVQLAFLSKFTSRTISISRLLAAFGIFKNFNDARLTIKSGGWKIKSSRTMYSSAAIKCFDYFYTEQSNVISRCYRLQWHKLKSYKWKLIKRLKKLRYNFKTLQAQNKLARWSNNYTIINMPINRQYEYDSNLNLGLILLIKGRTLPVTLQNSDFLMSLTTHAYNWKYIG